jgi:tetratricopeptide (TPR) repeat protein
VHPDVPDLYLLRGAIYASLGRYAEALQDIEKAIKLEPEYDQFSKYELRGRLRCLTGDTPGGLADLARVRAMQIPPEEAARIEGYSKECAL